MSEILKGLKPLWIFAIFMILISCSDDTEEPFVLEVESRWKTGSFSSIRFASDMRGLLGAFQSDLPVDKIQYDVEIFVIEYETKYGDETVVASGMIFLPVAEEPLPFLSYQHGTVADNFSVPSQAPLNDAQNLLLAGLAGTGFIVVAPDYVGFGSTVDVVHPYYVEQPTRDAVIDNIRAAAEMAVDEGRMINENLYLIGYSQGGYATMAAHKGIEEQGLEYFELQASYPSSGGYDIMGMRDYFLSLDVYSSPLYLAYVARAYQTYYGLSEDLFMKYFREPYATSIPDYFDGTFSNGQINDLLNDTLSVYLTEEFISNPDDPIFDEINDRFIENSLIDWVPSISMFMYHGDADSTVIYQNSIDSFDELISNGASRDIVTFTTLPGKTHGSGFIPYLEDVVPMILEAEGR